MFQRFCCMRLNTAGVAIGWIGAVFSLLGIIFCSFVLANADALTQDVIKTHGSMDAEMVHAGIVLVASVYLALIVINFLASILLVAGTIKERHLMLVPWLLNSGVSLVFNIIYGIAVLMKLISLGAPFGTIFGVFVFSGVPILIHFLIWFAIYSLYKTIQGQREPQQQLISGNTAVPNYTKI